MAIRIGPAKEKEIIRLYRDGYDTYETAIITDCSQATAYRVLKRNRIATRTKADYESDRLNYKLFDKIDSEAGAYFLGLMCADGNNYISKNNDYQLSISLQSDDLHILKTFTEYLCPDTIPKFRPRSKSHYKDQYCFRIDSKLISRQLSKLGCVPNKSLKLEMPAIPKHLLRHFIRGYFDGDGSISYWMKNNNKNYKWQITSTYNFCIDVQRMIKNELSVNSYLYIAKNDITTTLSSGGNKQVIKIMEWLYRDAGIYLDRKYKKFQQLKEIYL